MAEFSDFQKVDIRVGKIVDVQPFPEARRPAYRLQVDFGEELGVKRSCAQLTKNYQPDDLLGALVTCVVNFPPKQIGPAMSEVLILGMPDEAGEPVLVSPRSVVPLGGRFIKFCLLATIQRVLSISLGLGLYLCLGFILGIKKDGGGDQE